MGLYDNQWGMVLCGGGGKGAYQAGVFRAFDEVGISNCITAVSGASVGAINLILFESGTGEAAEYAWDNISPENFIQIDPDMIDGVEGLVSREGLLHMMHRYGDLTKVQQSEHDLYVSVTDCGTQKIGAGEARYISLNHLPVADIETVVLASSAMPIFYEPIEYKGHILRDGGLCDNSPIKPLYQAGIRHIIVVSMSPLYEVNQRDFPDAEFITIRPEKSIGDFFTGTLDFTPQGADLREKIGYADAMRMFKYYGLSKKDPLTQMQYENDIRLDYEQLKHEANKIALNKKVDSDFADLNALLNKYNI